MILRDRRQAPVVPRMIEVFLLDHVGRADAGLFRGQQSVSDQANNRHPVDAEAARGLGQD